MPLGQIAAPLPVKTGSSNTLLAFDPLEKPHLEWLAIRYGRIVVWLRPSVVVIVNIRP